MVLQEESPSKPADVSARGLMTEKLRGSEIRMCLQWQQTGCSGGTQQPGEGQWGFWYGFKGERLQSSPDLRDGL